MKLIVDTNIVFSGILNSESNISRIRVYSDHQFQFFAPGFLKDEIQTHRPKLRKYLKLENSKIDELIALTTSRINFINETVIPEKFWKEATTQLASIDPNDTPFVALTKYIKGTLWTGDKLLLRGLRSKTKIKVITTAEVIEKLK
jgi:predicted nucleic acid-binding protein